MTALIPYLSSRRLHSDLWDEIDRLWNSETPVSNFKSPANEVEEDSSKYTLSFDVPGIKKEDLKVEINGSLLSISGERRRSDDRSAGVFQKTLTLPENVNCEAVEALHENGVLHLILPKHPSAQPRQISIQTREQKIN